MIIVISAAFAQDVQVRDALTSGSTATTVHGGTFTGSGWRVDDSNSRQYWDLGTQVERGRVSVVIDDVYWDNLQGDNNHLIELFDDGGHWSAVRAINFRCYGPADPASWGDVKLKVWDSGTGLYAEDRGGIQDWDGGPHTWTIEWDTTTATLSRDGVELVNLDVTGIDLRVGTLWLPLNDWVGDYSAPIGALYSDLRLDAWEPADDGGGDDTGDGGGGQSGDGYAPIEDAGVLETYGSRVYDDETDLPLEGDSELSYLMFDLSALSGTVTAATLTLHAGTSASAEGDGGWAFAIADTSWTEDTLTWANRPSLGATLGSFDAVNAGDVVRIDVTDGVRAGGKVALAVGHGGENGAHFQSKEGGTAATLDVTVVPSDEETDSGTDGDSGADADAGGGADDADTDDATGAERPERRRGAADDGGCSCGGSGAGIGGIVVLLAALGGVRRRGA